MRTVLWPRHAGPSDSAIVRLGRVIHWLGAGIGGGFLLVGAGVALFTHDSAAYYDALGVMLWSIIGIFAARSVRYVLASE